mgnify:CR=1 FL=1
MLMGPNPPPNPDRDPNTGRQPMDGDRSGRGLTLIVFLATIALKRLIAHRGEQASKNAAGPETVELLNKSAAEANAPA